MLDDLNKACENTLYFFVGSLNSIVENSNKAFLNFSNQTQTVIDDLIQQGEIKYQEWFNQQPQSFATKEQTSQQPRREVRDKLFILVRGDWSLAERLLAQVRRTYPDHTESWYWEKVIYDLERDQL